MHAAPAHWGGRPRGRGCHRPTCRASSHLLLRCWVCGEPGHTSRGWLHTVSASRRGIGNNSVSSIRVPPGYKVEAFDSSDLSGTPLIISGDTPSLADRAFDNRISSVRISKITIGATFYQLCGKSGYNVTLPRELHDDKPCNVGHKGQRHFWSGADLRKGGRAVQRHLVRRLSPIRRMCRKLCLSGFDNLTSSVRIRSSSIVFSDNFNTGIQNWVISSGTWVAQSGTMVGTGNGDHGITFCEYQPNL